MENRYDITIPKPRRPVMPPPVPPPPFIPPRQQIINVNVTGNNTDSGTSVPYEVLSSLQEINSRLTIVETKIPTDFTQLELGEISGTAYPGDKGYLNAANIALISQTLQSFLSEDEFQQRIMSYATNDALNQARTSIITEVSAELETKVDSSTVSAIVSAMVSEITVPSGGGDQADYSDILDIVSNFNDGI